MLIPAANLKVYIATGSTDMRKAINGLSILVESRMELAPFSGNLFVFSNRRRDMIKILYWDQNGFCLWQKRLEQERFRWPESGTPLAIGRKNWLFAGSPAGARASANLYRLVETAKANGLEPYRYLRYIFEKLPYATTPEDYRKLTPLHLDRKEFDSSLL